MSKTDALGSCYPKVGMQRRSSTRSLPMLLKERACQVQKKTRVQAGGVVFATFIAVLLGSFATTNALSAVGLPAALLQEAVLALMALAAVGYAVPDALRRCAKSVQQRNTVRFAAVALLLTGLAGGVITLLAWLFADGGNAAGFVLAAPLSAADLMRNLSLLLGICLLTGLYEEAFMRVLGIEAFERALDAKRAILASAALFALLHVGVPDISASYLVLIQSALKFVQALLFGTILGVLYAQTRRLWPCVLIHAGFDVLYLAPNALLSGTMPGTYASGAASDIVLLAVTVLMLAGIVIKIRKEIAR